MHTQGLVWASTCLACSAPTPPPHQMTIKKLLKTLEDVSAYVDGVANGTLAADSEVVALLQTAVNAAPALHSTAFDKIFNSQVRNSAAACSCLPLPAGACPSLPPHSRPARTHLRAHADRALRGCKTCCLWATPNRPSPTVSCCCNPEVQDMLPCPSPLTPHPQPSFFLSSLAGAGYACRSLPGQPDPHAAGPGRETPVGGHGSQLRGREARCLEEPPGLAVGVV
jgi:hypothetical protein